jgi:hypothetical protein
MQLIAFNPDTRSFSAVTGSLLRPQLTQAQIDAGQSRVMREDDARAWGYID